MHFYQSFTNKIDGTIKNTWEENIEQVRTHNDKYAYSYSLCVFLLLYLLFVIEQRWLSSPSVWRLYDFSSVPHPPPSPHPRPHSYLFFTQCSWPSLQATTASWCPYLSCRPSVLWISTHALLHAVHFFSPAARFLCASKDLWLLWWLKQQWTFQCEPTAPTTEITIVVGFDSIGFLQVCWPLKTVLKTVEKTPQK